MKPKSKIVQLNGRPYKRGTPLKPGDSVVLETKLEDGYAYEYTCHRPPRPRTMSPVQYYKKFKVVDKDPFRVHNGRYYCNPAHCSRSWKSKAKRDEHLRQAYAML